SMSALAQDKFRYLDVARPRPCAPLRALAVFSNLLIVATFAACSESEPVPIEKFGSLEPAEHIVNVTNKGSRLDIRWIAVVADELEAEVASEPEAETKPAANPRNTLHGFASYYRRGTRTANGERFNEREMTAA